MKCYECDVVVVQSDQVVQNFSLSEVLYRMHGILFTFANWLMVKTNQRAVVMNGIC